MNVLFVHQNFPGQFRHLAIAMAADPSNRVVALCINAPGYPTPGVKVARYRPQRASNKDIFPLAADFEAKMIRAAAAAGACIELRKQGFQPDLIVVHPGWGEHMFLRDVFPRARCLAFLEFFYRAEGYDYDFDPEFSRDTVEGRMRLRAKNASLLSALDMMHWGLAPTHWQASSLPELYRSRASVIFDGVDTGFITPDAQAVFKLPDGREVRAGDEVLTFINRNLEPYRGFHVFMRALPAIQKARPGAVTLIVGGDEVSYGGKPREGGSWREVMLREVGDRLDMSRIVFLGRIPYAHYRQLLRVSRVHAYLTYPFVLSWSMLESMAAENLVIASATAPVKEVIRTGENGILVDFFDGDDWVRKISRALEKPSDYTDIRKQARRDILARYDLHGICLPEQLKLVRRVAGMAA
jgi:glycosyltransferase involved in cell wall biosynthesis